MCLSKLNNISGVFRYSGANETVLSCGENFNTGSHTHSLIHSTVCTVQLTGNLMLACLLLTSALWVHASSEYCARKEACPCLQVWVRVHNMPPYSVRIKHDFCEHVLNVTKIEIVTSGQHESIIAVCWSLESARQEDWVWIHETKWFWCGKTSSPHAAEFFIFERWQLNFQRWQPVRSNVENVR